MDQLPGHVGASEQQGLLLGDERWKPRGQDREPGQQGCEGCVQMEDGEGAQQGHEEEEGARGEGGMDVAQLGEEEGEERAEGAINGAQEGEEEADVDVSGLQAQQEGQQQPGQEGDVADETEELVEGHGLEEQQGDDDLASMEGVQGVRRMEEDGQRGGQLQGGKGGHGDDGSASMEGVQGGQDMEEDKQHGERLQGGEDGQGVDGEQGGQVQCMEEEQGGDGVKQMELQLGGEDGQGDEGQQEGHLQGGEEGQRDDGVTLGGGEQRPGGDEGQAGLGGAGPAMQQEQRSCQGSQGDWPGEPVVHLRRQQQWVQPQQQWQRQQQQQQAPMPPP